MTNNPKETFNATIGNTVLPAVFSVGDKVNYCNGLIFEIARINEEAQVCYDHKGMWYALVNCVNLSANGR